MNIDIIKQVQNERLTVYSIVDTSTDTVVAYAIEQDGGIDMFRFVPCQSAFTTKDKYAIANAFHQYYFKDKRKYIPVT